MIRVHVLIALIMTIALSVDPVTGAALASASEVEDEGASSEPERYAAIAATWEEAMNAEPSAAVDRGVAAGRLSAIGTLTERSRFRMPTSDSDNLVERIVLVVGGVEYLCPEPLNDTCKAVPVDSSVLVLGWFLPGSGRFEREVACLVALTPTPGEREQHDCRRLVPRADSNAADGAQ